MAVTHESDGVPPRVRAHLKTALDTLCGIKARLDQVRWIDDKFAGNGRYETEAYPGLMDEAEGWLTVVEKFKAAAVKQGVDGAAVIADMGGVPDLKMSDRGRRYADGVQGVA